MKYTIEDIRKALIPIIGDGNATQQILESFDTQNVPKMPSLNADYTGKVIQKNHIVSDSYGALYRVVHISDQGHYKCKGWNGNNIIDYGPADITLATHEERTIYYKNQVEFLRTNIAPFLNYFHMRQLYQQLKHIGTKEKMSGELDTIEQSCFTKLQDIKKLW